jgi:hypothetical protein
MTMGRFAGIGLVALGMQPLQLTCFPYYWAELHSGVGPTKLAPRRRTQASGRFA